ncbi:redoxin domain-containing protein [Algoriphagus marinus]|uniref:redoxin domain-containing protein n=1 Tax=Algoriphagus marinus TaxID=1925762 RepID=UPI00094BA12F|nr:redoxin domain-containing protein [Algoriphagus marinus]
MKKLIFFFLSFILSLSLSAQTLPEVSLTDAVTGGTVKVSSKSGDKGLVIIFHSLGCPFAKMYESRIKDLRVRFQSQGINIILVNPEIGNSPDEQTPLKNFIDQSGINTAYLIDEKQELTKLLQISKIPEAVLLTRGADGLKVRYRGAIDNNPQAETSVSDRYLERAMNQVLRGEDPTPSQVRAVGCNIRTF